MKTSKKRALMGWFALALLVLLALAVRVYDLESLPDGLFCDEAANGCDAFSILKTGRNIHGEKMPLLMNHHNIDRVEALYTYLTVPIVALFGLSVFSTRLVAALAGAGVVLTTFLLVREWLGKREAFLAAFLVACSPWGLSFSRIAFRGILLPLFSTLGCFLFLRSLKDRRFGVPCGLAFGLSLHSYSVAKLVVPVMVLCLLFLYREDLGAVLRSNRRARVHALAAAAVFLALALPAYHASFWGGGNARLRDISVFSASRPFLQFALNYCCHLTPGFLFFNGDPNPRHLLPGFGQLLVVLLPFALVGLGVALHTREKRRLAPALFYLLGIVPPALTLGDMPHSLRAIGAFPFLEIVAASGIVAFCAFLFSKARYAGSAAVALVAVALCLNAVHFLRSYFGDYRLLSRDSFQYGFKQAIAAAEAEAGPSDHIALCCGSKEAYVFPLFFAKLDPTEYQTKGSLGRYIVTGNASDLPETGHALLITDGKGPPGSRVIATLRGARGQTLMEVVR